MSGVNRICPVSKYRFLLASCHTDEMMFASDLLLRMVDIPSANA